MIDPSSTFRDQGFPSPRSVASSVAVMPRRLTSALTAPVRTLMTYPLGD
ncbi:MAG: hypothetical protein O6829_03965 [Alphaproteobacteria bacterium]|nr:hypothetical protein [Alphaproteobacteria bacterium]